MNLTSANGSSYSLRPIAYEFDSVVDAFDDFLVVEGAVRLEDGRSWSFNDPAILAEEARALGSWLHRAPSIPATPLPQAGQTAWAEQNMLAFIEPVIAFSVESHGSHSSSIRAHFSIEALPSWATESGFYDYFMVLDVENFRLEEAAKQWNAELAPFPMRATRGLS